MNSAMLGGRRITIPSCRITPHAVALRRVERCHDLAGDLDLLLTGTIGADTPAWPLHEAGLGVGVLGPGQHDDHRRLAGPDAPDDDALPWLDLARHLAADRAGQDDLRPLAEQQPVDLALGIQEVALDHPREGGKLGGIEPQPSILRAGRCDTAAWLAAAAGLLRRRSPGGQATEGEHQKGGRPPHVTPSRVPRPARSGRARGR